MSVRNVIARLEEMPKQGVPYDVKGSYGKRNPIRADTGPILQALVKAKRPKEVLEIGTAFGLSGCYIGEVLPEGAKMVTIEYDGDAAKEARANFKEAGLPILVLHDEAIQAIKLLATNGHKFDLVFLDANKDGYWGQFCALVEYHLLAENCLIIADNVIDRAAEMSAFLTEMQDYHAVILNTECGLLIANV